MAQLGGGIAQIITQRLRMYLRLWQIFIVVVSAVTAVTTTVQKFIVVVMPVTHVPTTLANIYREGREGGRKGSLLGALNLLKIGYI